MKVFIEDNSLFDKEVKYIFKIFSINKGFEYTLVNEENDSDLKISSRHDADISVSSEFYLKLAEGKYDHTNYFVHECLYIDTAGFADYLSSAFYIINSIQEINSPDEDQFGRFKYENSFQLKFKNIKSNIVQNIFDRLFDSIPQFRALKPVSRRTRIFLSHDIDTVNGSILQDSFYSIKTLRPDLLFKVLLYNLLEKPHWLNMDRMMKMESENDFTSTFFWLVNKGKTNYGLNNSDYNIDNRWVRKFISKIDNSEWENGIHKSASEDSFSDELAKLNVKTKGNRYHYLRFKPFSDFQKIEDAGLEFDSSLGFADISGFRNGYGLPFRPYDIKNRRVYDFVECPLHVMDTTYFNYLKMPAVGFVKETINFVNSNSSNAVITILFHNNFISDFKYKNYCSAFKKLLEYFHESDYKCITQSEIIKMYKHEH